MCWQLLHLIEFHTTRKNNTGSADIPLDPLPGFNLSSVTSESKSKFKKLIHTWKVRLINLKFGKEENLPQETYNFKVKTRLFLVFR
jgi:hypothetical protein